MTKVLIVTGGSRGIGHCVSVGAAKEGWDICINYKANQIRADETVELVKGLGRKSISVQADISKENEIILDPFCGGGVTIYEGIKNNRKVVGYDLNPLSIFITSNICNADFKSEA